MWRIGIGAALGLAIGAWLFGGARGPAADAPARSRATTAVESLGLPPAPATASALQAVPYPDRAPTGLRRRDVPRVLRALEDSPPAEAARPDDESEEARRQFTDAMRAAMEGDTP